MAAVYYYLVAQALNKAPQVLQTFEEPNDAYAVLNALNEEANQGIVYYYVTTIQPAYVYQD